MSAGFHIDKLSDEFGQYTLVMKCAQCGHERKAEPLTLGRLCGWDARLEDVAKRMRCSKCGKKRCTLRAFPPKSREATPRCQDKLLCRGPALFREDLHADQSAHH